MPVVTSHLSFLVFPQRWDGNDTIDLRILALPRGDPFQPFGAEPPFANTDLQLDAVVIPSLVSLPKPADPNQRFTLTLRTPPSRAALLTELGSHFEIAAAGTPIAAGARVKKYLTASYRAASNFSRPRTLMAVTDDAFRCALQDGQKPDIFPTDPLKQVTWGQVIGYALRQPLLAEELGLLYRTQLQLVPPDLLKDGGWLFVEPSPASAYSAGLLTGDVARFAARIPRLSGDRPLFAAALFPVTNAPGGNYDGVFVEAELYDDGFAQLVHGAQPISSGLIDTEPGHLPPARDLGIRLAWDDEQVAIWINRQIGVDPFTGGNSTLVAPMGVAGYRVDARLSGDAGPFSSLCAVEGPVKLGDFDLGVFQGEFGIETVPISLQARETGDFWLPSYFTSWAGGSLVLSDIQSYRLTGQDAIADGQVYSPVGAGAVELFYGNDYEFRVRLMDISGGGPVATDPPNHPVPAQVAKIPFRRFIAPGPVEILGGGMADDGTSASFEIARPRLGYPAAIFTPRATALTELIADRDAQLAAFEADPAAKLREISIPDPDVDRVRITVNVRGVQHGSSDFDFVYVAIRRFDADLESSLNVDLQFVDFEHVSDLPAPADDGPLTIPTAREIRLELTALGRDDPDHQYFGSDTARIGSVAVPIHVRAPAQAEANLLNPQTNAQRLQAIFLQPDPPPNVNFAAVHILAGRRNEVPADIAQRLARQLSLEVAGLSLSGKRDTRTVFGCSPALRHTISPDASRITFAAKTDLMHHWIVAIRLELNRDWSWDGLGPGGFKVLRDGVMIGTIPLPRIVSTSVAETADKNKTLLVYFDAIDPKPAPNEFPRELLFRYGVRATFRAPGPPPVTPWESDIRLPIASNPRQTPRLASAGLAFSDYVAAPDYSSTEVRRRMLWLEFDRPPDDPDDKYYARVLAYSPDPVLLSDFEAIPDPPEPELPIDPEPVRVITPGQSADSSGLEAMQELTASPDGIHYLVPLPPVLDAGSQELFGFFTYELRVGHDASRWSTAQGRFGPPLRVTGVQHPAPPLIPAIMRLPDHVRVCAPYAAPVLDGRILRPPVPRTDIWALLYVQVAQADGQSHRNVLLARMLAKPVRPANPNRAHADELLAYGCADFAQAGISQSLGRLGLPLDSPLSAVAVELLPEPSENVQLERPRSDPLGQFLGEVRILRCSPLTPVPEVCVAHMA